MFEATVTLSSETFGSTLDELQVSSCADMRTPCQGIAGLMSLSAASRKPYVCARSLWLAVHRNSAQQEGCGARCGHGGAGRSGGRRTARPAAGPGGTLLMTSC